MSGSLNVITIPVDGQETTLDVESDTSINDLTEDMDVIAPTIAWYGRVLAAARRAAERTDDEAKIWKAKFNDNLLSTDGKVAEWKAKAQMESHPQFARLREDCRAAWELVNRLDTALQALLIKADMLRSRGAWERAEMSATGMTTREPSPTHRSPSREAKVEAAKKAMRTRRKETEAIEDED